MTFSPPVSRCFFLPSDAQELLSGAEKSAGGRPDDAEIADVFARKAASGWGDTGGWGGTGARRERPAGRLSGVGS